MFTLLLGSILVGHGLCLLVYAIEHFRFHRSRLHHRINTSWTPQVTLFVPCKGLEVGLSDHLQSLFLQRYPRFDVCFVVESPHDPVLPVIRELQSHNTQVASRIVIAGEAPNSGQKVHNLIAATRTVSPQTDVLAFADSDAHPHPDWLRRLIGRLGSGENAVATGYRWYAPRVLTFPNLLLSGLNCLVLGLLGPTRFNLAWGGAWAIRRETFFKLGLPTAWEGTLSDDLTVSRLVHEAKLPVAYEPHCLTTSPASFQWGGLIEFIRRQYLIVRIYSPVWWFSSFVTGLLVHGGLWTVLILAIREWVWGGAATSTLPWVPAATAAVCFGLLALRAWTFTEAVRPFVRADARQFRFIQRLMICLCPLIMLINWLLLCSTIFGRTITWRGIGYRLDSATQTTVLFRSRSEPAGSEAVPIGSAASESTDRQQRAA